VAKNADFQVAIDNILEFLKYDNFIT